jgi:hypothetical protein
MVTGDWVERQGEECDESEYWRGDGLAEKKQK